MSLEKIIIDFDDTLFDTAFFKRDLLALFAAYSVSAEKFWETYETVYRRNDLAAYNLDRHIDLICRHFPNLNKKQMLSDTEAIFRNGRKYVIAGVPDFLNELHLLGIPLILLSLGDAVFQKKKVSATGLAIFFSQIIFTGRNKTEVVTPLIKDAVGDIIFVNDKIDETKKVAALSARIKPILRVKAEVALTEYKESGLPFYQTLEGILTHIKKYV